LLEGAQGRRRTARAFQYVSVSHSAQAFH
jgi:hypothetical protein